MEKGLVCLSVANRIIDRNNAYNDWRAGKKMDQVVMSLKRLQDIIYFIQVIWISANKTCDMIPEEFACWPQGPMMEGLYDFWQPYENITKTFKFYETRPLTETECIIVDRVVDNTINMTTDEIHEFACERKNPWHVALRSGLLKVSKTIILNYMFNVENKKKYLALAVDNKSVPAYVAENDYHFTKEEQHLYKMMLKFNSIDTGINMFELM